MPVEFIPNPAFQEEVKLSAELNAALLGMTEAAAGIARVLVPVVTGKLRDSIDAQLAEPGEARLLASAPYAAFVEFGTSEMAAEPFLAPAVEAVTA